MKNVSVLSHTSTPVWFGFPNPNPEASLRLFCFPWAGGGTNIFSKWQASLPPFVEVCLVHLPGREHRLRERPLASMSQLLEAIERPLLPFLDKPLALFGHSMGGLISFELARHLRRNYAIQPSHLFISGCRAPGAINLLPPIQHLSADRFLAELARLTGMSGQMTVNSQLMSLMLPTLKADFALCQTYSYAPEALLNCAISVYGGLQDSNVTYEDLEDWKRETTGPVTVHCFRGGHFFIQSAEPIFLSALSRDLQALAESVV